MIYDIIYACIYIYMFILAILQKAEAETQLQRAPHLPLSFWDRRKYNVYWGLSLDKGVCGTIKTKKEPHLQKGPRSTVVDVRPNHPGLLLGCLGDVLRPNTGGCWAWYNRTRVGY